MPLIDVTPESARKIYESMARKLKVVRRRLGKPLTLADKLLLGHLDDPERQDLEPGKSYLALRPDRVVFQDALAQPAMLQFMQTGLNRVAVPATIHCDHMIQAHQGSAEDLRQSIARDAEIYDFLRSAAARNGLGFWEPGAGIIHQVVLENYAFPGALIAGTDSHTPNAAGAGACGLGVGGAEAVEIIAGLPLEILYPRHIAVYLTGHLQGWTAPKDIILYVAGVLTVSGGTNAIIEYIGPGARTISATGKATISNMGAETGATSSIFPADERMAAYLKATGRGALVPLMEKYLHLLEPDPEVVAFPDQYYDRIVELDLSALEPHVVGPHSPDRARPLSQLAAEVADPRNGFVDKVSAALIGSCTNSSYEDMSRAADVADQARAHGLNAAVSYLVTPGSEQIRSTIERDGQMQSLKDIGGLVLANACGPCIAQWRRPEEVLGTPNTIVTSYNRNFAARNDGQATTMNFIASPEVVTALALAGRLSFNPLVDTLTGADGRPFKLSAPKAAPEVPAVNFDRGQSNFRAPPAAGSKVELRVNPASERLQLMKPWPAWDGKDFLKMPVLMKIRGKTTTDHISPGGPWMRLRGHLGKSSVSFLMGATNAYTGEAGKSKNALTGQAGQPAADNARDYQAKGLKWVVIGDSNYGEGSSREHAALYPRMLGGAAVIARSFARIHEANLKKQGLLALAFRSPLDYDRIREDDRVSLIGLKSMAAGKSVKCRIAHADGTAETLELFHSFTTAQLEWFRKGSALNLCRAPELVARRKSTRARPKNAAKKRTAARKVGRQKPAKRRAAKK
jgi:aconitate hydratase